MMTNEARETVYTVGHSNRSAEAFVELLHAHGIRHLADVRLIPRSARHPQFSRDSLDPFLARHGIAYRHFPDLGGRRRPRRDSPNTAWRVETFRGYADYMSTDTFKAALAALLAFAAGAKTSVMCAEAVWWQCHRRLLADALLVRGISVLHILSTGAPKPHELSEFARPDGIEVTYPGLL